MDEDFILCDGTINDKGFRLLMTGGRLERFIKNPIMFYDHNTNHLPIGHWTDIRIEEMRLLAKPVFSQLEFAQKIKKLVEEGTLRATSVGIDVLNVSSDETLMVEGQTRATVTEWEIYEVSIVSIPSNKNSVRLRKGGVTLSSDCSNDDLENFIPLVEKQNTEVKMEELLVKLGLSKDATEAEAIERLSSILKEREDSLIVLGTRNGVVDESNESTYRSLASSNYAATLQLVSVEKVTDKAVPPAKKQTLSSVIKGIKKEEKTLVVEDKETFEYLSKHNPEKLNTIRKEDPTKYRALAASYGK